MQPTIQIVDLGRGPQLSTSRITVLDVFYYLHRGRDWDIVHQAMPSLSQPEFDAIVAYVNDHRAELMEADREVEQRIEREIADQQARGLRHEIDQSASVTERAARLKEKMVRKLRERAERNGDHAPR